MISLDDLDDESIAELNNSYFERIASGDIKQMKLGNARVEVPYSEDRFVKVAKLVLKA
jgi:hypothetical protein